MSTKSTKTTSPIESPRIRLLSEEIDGLFEHYLQLLHQYDSLRSSLSTLQASIQQNIARANFDAPRGVRYGQDCYDQRMQAARRCCVTTDLEGTIYSVSDVQTLKSAASEGLREENVDADAREKEHDTELEKEDEGKATDEVKEGTKPKDPLRMFGILTPQALRLAQGGAIKMVEEIVPKLVQVDAEMKEVEIKIRRARKFRAKAEAAEKPVAAERMQEGVVS